MQNFKCDAFKKDYILIVNLNEILHAVHEHCLKISHHACIIFCCRRVNVLACVTGLLNTNPTAQTLMKVNCFSVMIRKLILRLPWLSFLGGRYFPVLHTPSTHLSALSLASSESGSGQHWNYWSCFCSMKLTKEFQTLGQSDAVMCYGKPSWDEL